jgi:hypothetical protein
MISAIFKSLRIGLLSLKNLLACVPKYLYCDFMRSIDSQPKRSTFDPISPEILQAVSDTGGVTDGSIIPLLQGLSPLEMRIKLTIQKYKPAYSAFAEARRQGGSKRRLKKQIKAVLEADRILKFWLPWFEGISRELFSVISKGEIRRAAKWLSLWPPQRGRRDEFILARCAEELAQVFKRSGRSRRPWTEIGEIIATEIPEAHAPHKSDLGHWIYQIVKRNRQRDRKRKKLRKIYRENLRAVG